MNILGADNNSRLLISQDRHEIYLSFAEYQEEYVKYLTNTQRRKATPAFLTMHQYGPWDTQNAFHMRDIGKILLAIALRAKSESMARSPA